MSADHGKQPEAAFPMLDSHPADLNSPMSIDQGQKPAFLMQDLHPVKVPSHHHRDVEIAVASKPLEEKENLSPEKKVYVGQPPLKKARLLSPNSLGALALLVPCYFFNAILSLLFCLCKNNGSKENSKPTAFPNLDSGEPRRKVQAPSRSNCKRKSEQQTWPALKRFIPNQDIGKLLEEMLENFTTVMELKLALKKEPNNKEKLAQKDHATVGFHLNKVDLMRYKDEGMIPPHVQDRANYLLDACIYN